MLEAAGDDVHPMPAFAEGQGQLFDIHQLAPEIRVLSPSGVVGVEVSLWIQKGDMHFIHKKCRKNVDKSTKKTIICKEVS